jgi:beta-glucosidase
MSKFPHNFFWGAATSSYQVEGNNTNADWWAWEKSAGKEQSGDACKHYELYNQDFDLAKSLNHNAHRLSIEWSRVEPNEGEFNQNEINHYIDVVKALRARNIEPVVTLHHFTNPIWFSNSGNWEKSNSVDRFAKFCDVIVKALAPYVHYWITINEPTIYCSHAFLFGTWPPQGKSFWRMKAVYDNMVKAHLAVYPRMNKIYKELNLAKPMISISHHISAMVPCDSSFRNKFAANLRDQIFSFDFLNKLAAKRTLDYIGLNYYSRQRVDTSSWWIGNLLLETCGKDHDPQDKNILGWDIYPKGLYQILIKLKKYNVPVIITENGICAKDDNQRWEFIRAHLKCIKRAMDEGANVQGYLYWSLLDNFEWAFGYGPRFGIVEVDYKTQTRTIRDSAKKLSEVIKSGELS